jgi:glutathione synthase/RimK-type ligase-like ATP-grasp enzyme
MTQLYDAAEWEAREQFVALIEAACKARGIRISWLSEYWLGILEKDNAHCYIHGYQFPINDTVSNGLMRDKVSTYELLTRYNVPALPHALVRLQPLPSIDVAVERAMTLYPLPLVLKPNPGWSGGEDVMRCYTKDDVYAAMRELASRHQSIAVSPYVDIHAEYRVLIIDRDVKVIFEKVRPDGIWHHNLKRGAIPKVVTDPALRQPLIVLAQKALASMAGRVAAVDIVDTPDGYQVLEVNGGISLSHFSDHSPEYKKIASAIYGDLIDKSFSD